MPTPTTLMPFAAAWLLAAPVAAQNADTLIPAEFAMVLLGSRNESGVTVGSVPDSVREALALEGVGQVVGTYASGSLHLIAVAVEGSPEEALVSYERRLEATGWTRAAGADDRRGGFRGPPAFEAPHSWCGREHTLGILPLRIHDRAYLRLGYSDGARSLCDPRMRRLGALPNRPGANLIPTLDPPEGADVRTSGVLGGGDDLFTGTRVTTALPVAAVIEHFDRALAAQGWEPEGGIGREDMALRRYRVSDEDGTAWIGTLSVLRVAEGTLYAEVRLARVESMR